MDKYYTFYALMEDLDGNTFSSPWPTGVGVTTEEEAKKFVAGATPGYDRSYYKVRVYESLEKAEKYRHER